MIQKIVSFLVIIILLFGCFPPSTSTIIGGQYEPETNTTSYFVIPYGNVTLPGKWTKVRYSAASKQQWFEDKDSVSVAIAFNKCDGYEFYKKELRDYAFVKAYYDWDSQYLCKQYNLTSEIIQADTTNNFIIWRLWGKNIDNYFLFGFSNCSVHNYTIESDKWGEKQKVNFLLDLYLKKK